MVNIATVENGEYKEKEERKPDERRKFEELEEYKAVRCEDFSVVNTVKDQWRFADNIMSGESTWVCFTWKFQEITW